MATRILLVLSIGGIAHAVLHASVALDKAGSLDVAERAKPLRADVRSGPKEPLCNPLRSIGGNVYTVGVSIGSPPQLLDLIVDTGSNNLVAESCKCKRSGWCDPINKCFYEKKSSTLVLDEGLKGPKTVVLYFGSGSILTEVATDAVHVGEAGATMEHGALLMIDQLLDFGGPFEGILGLGMPNSKDGPLALRIEERSHFFEKYLHGAKSVPAKLRKSIGDGNRSFTPLPLPTRRRNASKEKAWWRGAAAERNGSSLDKQSIPFIGHSFMRQANFSRFSVCFTDSLGEKGAADGGTLRFDPPPAKESFKNIGTMHWGLDFRGVSVGNASTKLGFCSGKGMPRKQHTPCGAIPDSGTTYILGPTDQLDTLFEEVCSQWPRCNTNHTKLVEAATKAKAAAEKAYGTDIWGIEPLSKLGVFQLLMQDCDSWLGEAAGMNELPPIHFHVADDTGLTKALTVDASVYIVSIKEPEMKQVIQHVDGLGDIAVGLEPTGREIWTCQAAFSSLDYPTKHNGPAWILGMPIFHRYTVGFDVAAKPPTISFTEGKCGDCGGGGGAALFERGEAVAASGSQSAHRPRRVWGRPRLPNIDITQPL